MIRAYSNFRVPDLRDRAAEDSQEAMLADKLKQILESFDRQWWTELQAKRVDELSAFDCVATVRNGVSHGTDSGITMATIRQYYGQIATVIEDRCDLLDPIPGSTGRS